MASPWGKIEKVESVSFAEIMSEQYARGVKNEREKIEYVSDGIDRGGDTKLEVIPEDVLQVIHEDETLAGAAFSEHCDSDALIARVLQSQYDHEYNEELKRIEKQKNQKSKIGISLCNYRRDGDLESEEEDDYFDDDCSSKKDWDRFETNEKLFESIPKCGFKVDQEGEMITKHDARICGVRNACKVMSFPPEFSTGDGAGFDMNLSNAAFNHLKTFLRTSAKKNKQQNRKERDLTAEMGVDLSTRLILYKVVNNQILQNINGIISTGKEALILHADSDPNYTGDLEVPKECAVKIFRTTLNEFKQRDRYIKEDYRFKERFSKQNNRVVIFMWAEKEMLNLKRMERCGIKCPRFVWLKKHVLVMSFVGLKQTAAPKLKDAQLTDAELCVAYEDIVKIMHKLYNEAKLVHADLSEYNILWHEGQCWIIDVAQSVEPDHPCALEFLMRDCSNITSFFTRRGLPKLLTKEQLFEHITGLNAESHNPAMLERIYTRGEPLLVASAPNQDTMPEEIKPLPYPFEVAWEKSLQEREKVKNAEVSAPVVETVEALQVLAIHGPVNCDQAAAGTSKN